MAKLWNTQQGKLHPAIEAYTVGEDYKLDMILMPYDIEASKAHAKGLHKIGILNDEELDQLIEGLDKLMKKWEAGDIEITLKDEDCHTVIENFLIEKYGEVGKKIHTARSRNDQVLTALRLMMKADIKKLTHATKELSQTFNKQAEKYPLSPLPGYTHTQQAMPSSVAMWCENFAEALNDDAEFLNTIYTHINKNPLGSAAGYGVSFPLDRKFTAQEMGFAEVQKNPIYCQNSRGKFESLFLEGLAQIMLTLGRYASDMLFFTTQECKFFSVDPSLTTGSSIMPQKKNLDGLEILRGNVSVIIGYQQIIKDISKGLISGYHRDLQLIKKYLIESIKIVITSIEVAKLYVEGSTPNEKEIEAKITPEIHMAEHANKLVQEKGIPFRDAYMQVKNQLEH